MESKPIKNLSQTFSGLPASKIHKTQFHGSIEVQLLTSDAIMEDHCIDSKKIKTAWVEADLDDKFFLQDKDIICPLKGMVFKPALIGKTLLESHRIVTNSNNAVVRPQQNIIIPEVLHFYLASQWFKERIIDKTQRNFMLISLKNLREVNIPLPDFSTQSSLEMEYYIGRDLKEKTAALINAQNLAIEAKFLSKLIPVLMENEDE